MVPATGGEEHTLNSSQVWSVTAWVEGTLIVPIYVSYLLAEVREALPARKAFAGMAPQGLEHVILDSLLARGHCHHGSPPFAPRGINQSRKPHFDGGFTAQFSCYCLSVYYHGRAANQWTKPLTSHDETFQFHLLVHMFFEPHTGSLLTLCVGKK